MHWIARRMLDPIKKLLEDLDLLAFKRSMILATIPGTQKVCLHRSCRERFERIDFFEGIDIVEVDGRNEALEAGSRGGWLCCCEDAVGDTQLFRSKA